MNTNINIRKILHDRLIADVADLKYLDGTTPLFNDVQKWFAGDEQPVVCEIISGPMNNESEGHSEDIRLYSFSAVMYDLFETNNDVDDATEKIDRLELIEDRFLEYLSQLPNPLRDLHGTEGIVVRNIGINGTDYQLYERATDGFRMYLVIDFTIYVSNIVQS